MWSHTERLVDAVVEESIQWTGYSRHSWNQMKFTSPPFIRLLCDNRRWQISLWQQKLSLTHSHQKWISNIDEQKKQVSDKRFSDWTHVLHTSQMTSNHNCMSVKWWNLWRQQDRSILPGACMAKIQNCEEKGKMGLTRFEDLQDWKDQWEGCHSTDYSAHFCLAQGDKLLWPFFFPPSYLSSNNPQLNMIQFTSLRDSTM